MKIIFLDFYGVMDGDYEWQRQRKSYDPYERFDPRCGARVKRIHEETGALVVITSDSVQDCTGHWEGAPSDEQRYPDCKKLLVGCGVPEEIIIGYTYQPPDSLPVYDRTRQIKTWLDEHPEVENYVILDDLMLPFSEEDVAELTTDRNWPDQEKVRRYLDQLEPYPEMLPHFVLVRPPEGQWRQDALRDEHVERAIEILNG